MISYYIPEKQVEVSVNYLNERGIPLDDFYAQSRLGIFLLVIKEQSIDTTTHYFANAVYTEKYGYYEKSFAVCVKPPQQVEADFIHDKMQLAKERFADTFKILDQMSIRATQSVITALACGLPAQEKDADILWQIEEVKKENRELYSNLLSSSTMEEAKIINAWLPYTV